MRRWMCSKSRSRLSARDNLSAGSAENRRFEDRRSCPKARTTGDTGRVKRSDCPLCSSVSWEGTIETAFSTELSNRLETGDAYVEWHGGVHPRGAGRRGADAGRA